MNLINVSADVRLTAPGKLLESKCIIITGGTKGLGLAMAKKFKSEGAKVLITGRSETIAKHVADEIDVLSLPLDLQEPSTFEIFVEEAVRMLGGVDCLVNNAGISLHENTFFDVTPETFNSQLKTNFEGPFFLTQIVARIMIAKRTSEEMGASKGNILFISSETGFTADIRPYGLTKAAINSLVEGLAYLFCKNGIRVNAIAPGVVATDMTGHSPSGNLEYAFNSIGRLYLPEEIAEVATFLLSDASATISGQILTCNNARTINARWK